MHNICIKPQTLAKNVENNNKCTLRQNKENAMHNTFATKRVVEFLTMKKVHT